MGLICISLMIIILNTFYVFIFHSYIFLVNSLLTSSAHLLIALFVFLFYEFGSYLYTLDTKPPSDMLLANVFSQLVASLFLKHLY